MKMEIPTAAATAAVNRSPITAVNPSDITVNCSRIKAVNPSALTVNP
jgi:hypothetical protein